MHHSDQMSSILYKSTNEQGNEKLVLTLTSSEDSENTFF